MLDANINIHKDAIEPIASSIDNFINKIGSAIGFFFIEEKSKKEQIAKIYKEIGENKDISLLTRYAFMTISNKQLKEYCNQLNIIKIATENLPSTSNSDKMDDDWISYFFDKAKNISNPDMQLVWGKILAEESNPSSHVPKSLINTLSLIEKYQAEQFQKICQYQVQIADDADNKKLVIPLHEVNKKYFDDITSIKLSELDNLGLISYASIGTKGFLANINNINCSYFGESFNISLSPGSYQIFTGSVDFTMNGLILSKIITSKPLPYFFEMLDEYCTLQKYHFSR